MDVASAGPNTTRARAGLAAALLLSAAAGVAWTPLFAQANEIPLTGRVVDARQRPLEGYRVVLRVPGQQDFVLTPPTDVEGSYRVDVRTGTNLAPVAVFAPDGRRLPVEGITPRAVLPGVRFDIELAVAVKPARDPRPFDGADRRFLRFAEDVAFVEGQRYEADLSLDSSDDAATAVSRFVAAFGLGALPRIELGGRIGYAGTDYDAGGGSAGATDLEAWGKYYLGSSPTSALRYGAGAVLTLPTADEETGPGFGTARAKLFGTVRWNVGRFTLSGDLGASFADNATIGGVETDAGVAASFGAAALYEVGPRLVAVGELAFEGEQWEGAGDDGRLLLGVNWKPIEPGFFRLAVAFGLTDDTPDAGLFAGWAFDF